MVSKMYAEPSLFLPEKKILFCVQKTTNGFGFILVSLLLPLGEIAQWPLFLLKTSLELKKNITIANAAT